MNSSRLALFACALLVAAVAFAADTLRTFDIPAGDAGDSLRRFAQQAGREIVYPAQDVRGHATNAVRGELPVATALQQLLTGSRLTATVDAQTGALSVVVSPAPSAIKPTATPRTTVTPPTVSADSVVMMSPFNVAMEKDEGFVAATSLAGGRLSTQLKDTPVAYSVLTRDFLDALNLTDTEQAMTWAVGSYAPIVALSAYRYNDNEGGSSVMSRGVQTSGAQRNFFLLGLNSDTYSQERIDYARGPNALLIGNSGLGGVVNGLTKRARTDKAFDKLGLQFGSWNKFRTSLDLNHPINDKVAGRVNLLWQDANTWRDLEFDNRRGVHTAVTYRPFKRTQIRAEYEHYRQSTIMGRESMSDSVSGWDGVTTVSSPVAAVTNSDAKGIARLGSSTTPALIYIPGSDPGTVMNWANTWRTQGGAANAAVPIGGRFALSTANLGINGGTMVASTYSPDLLFGLAEAGSLFRRPTRETVIQPDMPTLEYSFQNAAIFIEHQQGRHLFFEAAYNYAHTNKHVETAASRMGNATIDVNRNLPDGRPNPNFGQVYSEALASAFYYRHKINEGRAAVAVVFDQTRWGDFRANFIGGIRDVRANNYSFVSVLDRNPDVRRRSVDDVFTYRFYWNALRQPTLYPDSVRVVDPVAGTTTNYHVTRVADLRTGVPRATDSTFKYLQSAFNAKVLGGRLNLIAGARRDQVETSAYSGNSTNNMMADYPVDWDQRTIIYRPVGPADYFNLKYQAKNAAGALTGNGAFLDAAARPRDANFKPLPQYANDRFRDDYSSPKVNVATTTISYGGVLHVTRTISAYANYAESFLPQGSGVTLTGNPVPVSSGDGWDAGLRFTLLEGKISASFGTYAGSRRDRATDSTSNSRKYATIVDANTVGDLSPNGINARGLIPPANVTFDYSDTENEGYEIDIVANLTRNWRLTANSGIPKNRTLNSRKDEWAYLTANEPTLRQIVLDAGGLIDANHTATVDLSVPVSNRSPDVSAAVAAWSSIQTFKATNNRTQATESDQPKFTANLYSDYRFSRGPVKGLRVGAGVQYIGRTAIGNRGADTIVNPANPNTAIDDPSVDAQTRVYRDAYYTATATFGYQYRLQGNRTVDLNFRIGNLLNNTDLIYIGAGLRPPGGDITRPNRVTVPTTFVYRQPRSYQLSATLGF
ncbi:MAG: hypothetical protein Q8N18_02955 [Opitutaceae bacterium]|nr:hypothetical protein [Opitutaceae bacterium]